MLEFISPNWPAPANVVAAVTTRKGGHCSGPYTSGNMAMHVGDDEQQVAMNRQLLAESLGVDQISWLEQVHGIEVVAASPKLQTADAVFTDQKSLACAVMTADCLPLLLCNVSGTEVAALHCGWRSLAGGVIQNTLSAMATEPGQLMAWMGPAIGPETFEVGQDVYDVFALQPWFQASAFRAISHTKYLANIYSLTQSALRYSGVNAVYGGGFCTFTELDRFYSFRREKVTGRMAALISIR